MDTTVERLKVGTQVIIGSYGVNNDEPHPVVWLKGSPNCDFITECAVDYLCFDAPERTGDGRRNLGNPDYRLSNIHTYLNSDRDDWFRKTHEADAPPNNVFSSRAQSYRNHQVLSFTKPTQITTIILNLTKKIRANAARSAPCR